MADRIQIEQALTDLADSIEWPRADISPAVGTVIQQPSPTSASHGRRWAVAAGVAAMVFVLLVAWSPARQAIADLLGLAGVRIEWSNDPAPAGAELDLGEPSDLGSAARNATYALLAPGPEGIGPPDGVFVTENRVSMAWRSEPDLPAAGDSGIGLLVTQFPASVDRGLIGKRLGPETRIRSVRVRGEVGYWIEGAPHTLLFLGPDGEVVEDMTRLAGNVLLWEEAGATRRIESMLDFEGSLELAESLVER